jgi:hypothetical protein
MKTWADVQKFITDHKLAFKVERFNMSLRGCLTLDDKAVAHTVKDAAKYLRFVTRVK